MWIRLSEHQNAETECHGRLVAICLAADFGNNLLLRACRTGHDRRGLVFFPTSDHKTAGPSTNESQYKATVMHPLEHVRATVCTSVCGFLNHIDRLALPNKNRARRIALLLLERSGWEPRPCDRGEDHQGAVFPWLGWIKKAIAKVQECKRSVSHQPVASF